MERSVVELLERYPAATLQDIYKTMFQDRFGVAHMLASRERVKEYIATEAQLAEGDTQCYIEACGWRGDYIRVDLRAIRDGIMSADELTDAFMASAECGIDISAESIEAWQREWNEIVRVCHPMLRGIEGFKSDSTAIAKHIAEGNYVMHHSEVYNANYAPHYRIVHRTMIEALPSLARR